MLPQLLEFFGRRMLGWNEVNTAIFCFIYTADKGLELRVLPVIERGGRSDCDGVNLEASVNGEQITTARIKAVCVMHLDTAREIGLVDLNLVGEGQSGHLTSAEVAAGKSAARKDDGET